MLKKLIRASLIAALYFMLTYGTSPIAFGPVQVRISEALTVLPFFLPEAVFGITIGCFLSNLFSPFGFIDIIIGTSLTFLAGMLTMYIGKKTKNKYLAPIPPIFLNAFGVAFYVVFLSQIPPLNLSNIKGLSDSFLYIIQNFSWYPYIVGVLTIGLSEALATYVLGIPLLYFVERRIMQ